MLTFIICGHPHVSSLMLLSQDDTVPEEDDHNDDVLIPYGVFVTVGHVGCDC